MRVDNAVNLLVILEEVQAAMSKIRQAYAKKASPLFDWDSIFEQLYHSSFGRFQSAVQSVNSLLPDVDLIFELPTDLDTITDDQIVIKICQMDVPTIELIDLPGIQMYPPELYQQTTDLVNRYVNAPDTLVLCVVDATIPSLDSSVAIKAVRDANKLPRTILALTKSDLIHDEESIVEQIFDRVLGNSAETKDLAGLAGCVAVVNRII
ncbi:hypothetical protein WJX77_009690 [Trebouxia sp. C0004]